MAVFKNITAGTLRAILCFISPNQTPSMEFKNVSISLIEKIKSTVRNYDGSISVLLSFANDETDLHQEFAELCERIARHYKTMEIFRSVEAELLTGILCFIDPTQTPKIAFDNDVLAIPLIEKVKIAVGDNDGSRYVEIEFSDEESDLYRQFSGVCENISALFQSISDMSFFVIQNGDIRT